MTDDPLGLGIGPAAAPTAWRMPAPEPTNLIAPWPDPEAPDAETLGAAVADALGAAADVEALPAPAPEIVELLLVRSDALPMPMALWCERSRGAAPDGLGTEAAAARWVIGVEATLDPADPLAGYAAAMRMLARIRPDLPAVLDVNTGIWRGREMLRRQYADAPVEPAADALWMIQVVGPGAGPLWVRTVGLHRCGRPELELLEVPSAHRSAATALLNDVAALLLETTTWPAPGEPFEVGPGLRLLLQPAEEAAAFVAEGAAGAAMQRPDGAGPGAAVCDVEPRGSFRPVFTWPQSVIDAIEHGASAIYRAPRASRRQAELARATWPGLLASLAAAHGAGELETLVEAGFETAEGSREHLWFAVDDVVDDELDGRLAHAPSRITTLREGQSLRLRRDMVSDWLVRAGGRRYGPDNLAALEAWVAGRSAGGSS
ncbi:MAG: DUF4026 domain-containing protein [Planctomycetota bacterium]|jgi:hypothetical protein